MAAVGAVMVAVVVVATVTPGERSVSQRSLFCFHLYLFLSLSQRPDTSFTKPNLTAPKFSHVFGIWNFALLEPNLGEKKTTWKYTDKNKKQRRQYPEQQRKGEEGMEKISLWFIYRGLHMNSCSFLLFKKVVTIFCFLTQKMLQLWSSRSGIIGLWAAGLSKIMPKTVCVFH